MNYNIETTQYLAETIPRKRFCVEAFSHQNDFFTQSAFTLKVTKGTGVLS